MRDGATLRSSPPWHVRAAETQVRSALSPCGVHGKDKRSPIVDALSDLFQILRHRHIDGTRGMGSSAFREQLRSVIGPRGDNPTSFKI